MRFLFVAPRYHTNQFFVVKTLLEKGHEVAFHVLYEGKSEDHSLLKPTVVRTSFLFRLLATLFKKQDDENFRYKYGFPPLWHYLEKVRRFNPDIMVIRSDCLIFALIAMLTGILQSKALVFYSNAPLYSGSSKKSRVIKNLLIKWTKGAWITPVEGVRKEGTSRISHSYYLPFPCLANGQVDKLWFRDNKINILMIGKYQPRKNHLLLIQAIEELLNSPEKLALPVKVTLIGEISSEDHERQFRLIQQYVEDNGLNGLVEFKCNLPFSVVQEEYLKHDIFVLPSSREPVGVSVLEAMAHGLPVICSDSAGAASYVRNGINGHIFKSDDIHSLTGELEKLLGNTEQIVKKGEASKWIVSTEHHPEEYYGRLMSLVRSRFGFQ
jgi:glycosyltransferase involved in cell wall biosynthesis